MQLLPDPPDVSTKGAIAQLGERLLCKQEVIGSIPIGSTSLMPLDSETSNHSFCCNAWRVRTLFNNPEVLFLTLSFQANVYMFVLKMSRSQNVNQLKR